MRLYETRTGEIVGTQAEAKASGKGWQLVDVPVDKAGLIAHLNSNRHIPCDLPHETTERLPAPPVSAAPAPAAGPFTLTDAEEFIQNADAGPLASLANNVCWRIKELTKSLA